MYNGRIKRELKDLSEGFTNRAKDELVVQAKLFGDQTDLRHWTGKIFGPVSHLI